MGQICDKAKYLKKGSWFLTLTKRLPTADEQYITEEKDDRDWECVKSVKLKMSWGLATVNIHRKLKHPPNQSELDWRYAVYFDLLITLNNNDLIQ